MAQHNMQIEFEEQLLAIQAFEERCHVLYSENGNMYICYDKSTHTTQQHVKNLGD